MHYDSDEILFRTRSYSMKRIHNELGDVELISMSSRTKVQG